MSTEPEQFQHPISQSIRSIALSLPETTEGSSCVNRAFKAGGKNFAFLGEQETGCGLRLKLGPSLDDVTVRSADDPEHFEVGTHGWTMLRFDADAGPSDELELWITESFRLLAPKRIVATLDA